jgi:hypothetical protein
MQASLPACGWHCRPSITLPLAMIGPELADARAVASSTFVSHTSAPVLASMAYIWLSALPSMIVVPQMAMLRLVPPRHASGSLRRFSQIRSPVLALIAWM